MALTPPDIARCQSDRIGHGPFVMGGIVGDPRRGYLYRCRDAPDHVAVENRPGADGLRGSMSLCAHCAGVLQEQEGADFARLLPIKKYAAAQAMLEGTDGE